MKLTYDPRYNIAYIALRDKTEPVEILQFSDELHIDIAPDGTIYGIELLNANQRRLTSSPAWLSSTKRSANQLKSSSPCNQPDRTCTQTNDSAGRGLVSGSGGG